MSFLKGVATGFLNNNNRRHDRLKERVQSLADNTALADEQRANSEYSYNIGKMRKEQEEYEELLESGAIDPKTNLYREAYQRQQAKAEWAISGKKKEFSQVDVDNYISGKPKGFKRQYNDKATIDNNLNETLSGIREKQKNAGRGVATNFENLIMGGVKETGSSFINTFRDKSKPKSTNSFFGAEESVSEINNQMKFEDTTPTNFNALPNVSQGFSEDELNEVTPLQGIRRDINKKERVLVDFPLYDTDGGAIEAAGVYVNTTTDSFGNTVQQYEKFTDGQFVELSNVSQVETKAVDPYAGAKSSKESSVKALSVVTGAIESSYALNQVFVSSAFGGSGAYNTVTAALGNFFNVFDDLKDTEARNNALNTDLGTALDKLRGDTVALDGIRDGVIRGLVAEGGPTMVRDVRARTEELGREATMTELAALEKRNPEAKAFVTRARKDLQQSSVGAFESERHRFVRMALRAYTQGENKISVAAAENMIADLGGTGSANEFLARVSQFRKGFISESFRHLNDLHNASIYAQSNGNFYQEEMKVKGFSQVFPAEERFISPEGSTLVIKSGYKKNGDPVRYFMTNTQGGAINVIDLKMNDKGQFPKGTNNSLRRLDILRSTYTKKVLLDGTVIN